MPMIENNPPKHLIDWLELDDNTAEPPCLVAAFRGMEHDIIILAPTELSGYTVIVPMMTLAHVWQYRTWAETTKVAAACPQKPNGPLGTIVLLRSRTGLYEVRRYRDRYEVRRTEGRNRKVMAVFDADVVKGIQAQYEEAVSFAVAKSSDTT